MAAMRRTIQVMYFLRAMPRRRASLSINSATSMSRVKPARAPLHQIQTRGMETNWFPFGDLNVWTGLGQASSSPSPSAPMA